MITLRNINKSYNKKQVITNFNIKINKGEKIAFTGSSGIGKTTLLNIIGLLESFDSGNFILDDKDITKCSDSDKRKLFKRKFGYLFQNFALLEDESIYYNLDITFPKKIKKAERMSRIKDSLVLVGLNEAISKKVYQLSGGQQQRLAIARVIIKDCDIILADEPTGSLDDVNKDIILALLDKLNSEGKTIILVTHDNSVATWANRIITL